MRLADVVAALGGTLHGDPDQAVHRLAPLESADAHSLGFLANPRYAAQLATTAAGCVIVAPAQQEAATARGAAIVTPDPYLYFARLTQWWAARTRRPAVVGVHPGAVVEPGAVIDPTASIGALAFIGAGARIGPGVVVGTRRRAPACSKAYAIDTSFTSLKRLPISSMPIGNPSTPSPACMLIAGSPDCAAAAHVLPGCTSPTSTGFCRMVGYANASIDRLSNKRSNRARNTTCLAIVF